ncbi:MAG: flagellar biosynthetic protein FliQ [Bdellovibrionales bacterium CG12_big_fil_rev_8_21_14_0_65_38_15]|nr:MAG: flagellar biosynthetic protein FliQ [Bdellovibrionales bacterium CG22_combo_CG10-13_8_21_14_all_38_13]PIQ54699.1 MAG: flagellar biosynthetic protein FliQ [Bdellovibrionales bacterium CG12_big_fil_rev_8_21_14_0_65_38_15]PIR30847.1 MAG: flagellar biosynthetic protein FliQ [Bdellovibrionales bacterium CG11_big_fil_rev_8_21_14_0_20_38_13]
MGFDAFTEVSNQAIKVTLYIASPMLIGALLIGIMVSIFQAVTQINEQTLSFIPKIVVIVGALVIFAPWMSETLTSFTKDLIINIPAMVAVGN